jgi:hypothetical protein
LTSGRFKTSFWLTARDRDAVVVSISGASPTTDTTSLTLPGSMVASMRALRPTSSTIPVRRKFLKPSSATSTWY